MKTNTSKRTLIIRAAAILALIVLGYVMSIIGRGHTIYFDNKTLEYNGTEYKAPYKVVIFVDDEQVAKLYSKERGSSVCIGQKLTVTLEITQEKGGDETTQTYTIALPRKMDNIIINLPAYLAGLGEDAYLSEFIAAPDTAIDEEPVTDDDGLGLIDDGTGELEGLA